MAVKARVLRSMARWRYCRGKWLCFLLLWDTWGRKNRDLVLSPISYLLVSIITYHILYSSVVIDDLFTQLNDHSHIGIACLYADYKDQNNQTLVHILGSFLHQFLTNTQVPIPDEVTQKLQEIRRRGMKLEINDTLALLETRFNQLKRVFICIDAIDELEPKILQQLLDVLKGLVTKNHIRLFLTGRPHIESEVQRYLQVGPRCKVDISANLQDIQEFVQQQITGDLNPDAMDEVLAKDIVDAIIEKSQGM